MATVSVAAVARALTWGRSGVARALAKMARVDAALPAPDPAAAARGERRRICLLVAGLYAFNVMDAAVDLVGWTTTVGESFMPFYGFYLFVILILSVAATFFNLMATLTSIPILILHYTGKSQFPRVCLLLAMTMTGLLRVTMLLLTVDAAREAGAQAERTSVLAQKAQLAVAVEAAGADALWQIRK
ncbi:Protein of unknown function, partial [Gryllus bimaculatus]